MFARSLRSTVASSSRLHLESALPRCTLFRSQPTNVLSSGYATKSASKSKSKSPSKSISKSKKVPAPSGKETNIEKDSLEAGIVDEEGILDENNDNLDKLGVDFNSIPDEELNVTSLSKVTINTIGENHGEYHKTFGGKRTQNKFIKELNAVKLVKPDSTQTDFPYAPKRQLWDQTFYKVQGINTRHRMFISNVETAKNAVEALTLDKQKQAAGERITVVEGYPGIGSLTRELCRHKAVEKVIAFEDHASFNKALRNLKDADEKAAEKLDVVPLSCFQWESYDQLINLGGLDNIAGVREERKGEADYKNGIFSSESWKKPSSILFLAQLPNTVHSEQLVSQLLRSISNRYWLYRYARVRMAFICSHQMAMRCIAQQSERLYGKLTMVAAATADCKIALGTSNFTPYPDHFWPTKPAMGPQTPMTLHQASLRDHRIQPTPAKLDQCLLILEPKVKPLIEGSSELESFDYLTKSLFILRSSPVKKALSKLAPGAEVILDTMNAGKHPAMQEIGNVTIDPKSIVSDLTLTQLIGLSKMFERWPFRPVNLFEEGRIEEIADHKVFR